MDEPRRLVVAVIAAIAIVAFIVFARGAANHDAPGMSPSGTSPAGVVITTTAEPGAGRPPRVARHRQEEVRWRSRRTGRSRRSAASRCPAPTRSCSPSSSSTAFLTYLIPAGTYELDENGQPIPGTYHQVESTPQRIVVDSLMAPINGLYGIESAEDGSISVWNSGELFGAIDVALFILVIGGFLGVTMKTGAIQVGIARIVARLKGRERWMIPILMAVFALGGTTFGMAEESLAFYALIITVMIAAGYDALVGASIVLLGCGIGVLGSTINPFATGIASGFAGTSISEGLIGRVVILVVGTAIGIVFVLRYADRIKADPGRSLVFSMKAENEARFRATGGERRARSRRPQQVGAGAVLPGVRRDDLRRHPVGGPGHRRADAVVVVPGDDRVVPAVRDPHRARRADVRERASRRPSSTAPATCSASP